MIQISSLLVYIYAWVWVKYYSDDLNQQNYQDEIQTENNEASNSVQGISIWNS